jgi:ADP-ribose pyrophosphatase YjhB (NUDIX family)
MPMAGPELVIDLHVILRDGSNVLFGLRKNTGFCDGMYHLPAGQLEEGETILNGTAREAREELGIDIEIADLVLVHTMHHRSGRVAFFFEAVKWAGDAINAEPHECESLAWFPHDRLPENLVPYARAALERIDDGKTVSAFGWD